jgi:hypothetical protein
MNKDITFHANGIPIPHIYNLVSYEIKEDSGYIHFYGWYPIIEIKEPSGTELDKYDDIFTLPKQMYMIIQSYEDNGNTVCKLYDIEVYERIIYTEDPLLYSDNSIGTDQCINFKIIKTI